MNSIAFGKPIKVIAGHWLKFFNLLSKLKIMKFFAPVFMCLLFHFASAQTVDTAKLNAYFDVLESNNKFMGSITISKGGQVIYDRQCGFAEVSEAARANVETRYRVGSISKTFTTVLVMKAIEKKKLTFDTQLGKFFPEITHADQITIRNLLNHTSGIHNFTNDMQYLIWNTLPHTEEEMVKIVAAGGSDFAPGSKAAYSNSNFVLLTYIVEKVLSDSYGNLVDQYIIKPLGLKHTSLGSKIMAADNEARSYKYFGSWVVDRETDMSVPVGAGAIISSPSDLCRFASGLFGVKLTTQESFDSMKSIHNGFGMGLFPIPFYERKALGHTGSIDGFQSVFAYFPEEDVCYALTANGVNMVVNDISIAVLSATFGRPFEIPEYKIIHFSPEELEAFSGTYASNLIPLKITISSQNGQLLAQATGQAPFPLDAIDKQNFEYKAAGVLMIFDTENRSFTLKQSGAVFEYKKEQ